MVQSEGGRLHYKNLGEDGFGETVVIKDGLILMRFIKVSR